MTCENASELINAYIDGLLSDEDRKSLEAHIASCSSCRVKLDELTKTVGLVKNLNSVVAPPWFSRQVMNKLNAEAEKDRSLLRKLFLPLYIKLPVQAIAAVAIAFLMIHIYQVAEPEISPNLYTQQNLGEVSQTAKSSDALRQSAPNNKAVSEAITKSRKEIELKQENQGIKPAAPSTIIEPSGSVAKSEEARKEKPAPIKLEKDETASGEPTRQKQQIRMNGGKSVKGETQLDKPAEDEKPDDELSASAHTAIVPPPVMIELSVKVADQAKSVKDITAMLEGMKVRIIGKYSTGKDIAVLAEMKGSQAGKVIDKLKAFGEVSASGRNIRVEEDKAVIRIKIVSP
jgi:hypothetical protein